MLHTLLVKYYNDLLDRQSSELSRDEVTYFYVGDVTTMKSLELFPRNLRKDFFLKIGIFSVKVYKKKSPT